MNDDTANYLFAKTSKNATNSILTYVERNDNLVQ